MSIVNYGTPGGYEVVAVGDTVMGLTDAKVGVGRDTQAVISVENYNIRWTCDGTEPSATVGMLLSAGDTLVLTGKESLSNLQMHFVTSEASVRVHYFHQL